METIPSLLNVASSAQAFIKTLKKGCLFLCGMPLCHFICIDFNRIKLI